VSEVCAGFVLKKQIAAQKRLAMTGGSVTASPDSGMKANPQAREGRGSLNLVQLAKMKGRSPYPALR